MAILSRSGGDMCCDNKVSTFESLCVALRSHVRPLTHTTPPDHTQHITSHITLTGTLVDRADLLRAEAEGEEEGGLCYSVPGSPSSPSSGRFLRNFLFQEETALSFHADRAGAYRSYRSCRYVRGRRGVHAMISWHILF